MFIKNEAVLLKKFQVIRSRVKPVSSPSALLVAESKAREMVARELSSVLVRKFGKRLKAVVLAGSSQLGVRRASPFREGSDIDIRVVLSQRVWKDSKGFIVTQDMWKDYFELLAEQVEKVTGVKCQLMPESVRSFLHHERTSFRYDPFQVIRGNSWLEHTLGKKLLADKRSARAYKRNDTKYVGGAVNV